jgi:sodium transport system permease protein
MRWSIIRLIWLRELRDQLRDRRTVFMIAILPVLIYPLAGRGMLQLFQGQVHVVGLAGARNLLPANTPAPASSPIRSASWLALTPPPPGDFGAARVAGAVSLVLAQPNLAFPPLVEQDDGRLVFAPRYLGPSASPLLLRRLDEPVPATADSEELLAPYRRALDDRKADVVLVVPPGFGDRLERGERPAVFLFTREKDDVAQLVNARVTGALGRWLHDLKAVRLARSGLPEDFDVAAVLYDPERAKSASERQEENLFTMLVRVFPFILVLWSLAGALYPAIDLCAGEKERGTMETLLISPASREEIVYGKFLTIWLFSAVTALLNLLSMAVTVWQLGASGGGVGFRFAALFWSLALLMPLSAFFSALCLAVGAYARSSKEGQYYLMPLFLVTMPLIFLTLVPGVELNPFYSMVPVTGVALLLQKLVAAESADRGLWLYFVPVLAPMVVYSWLALRWAIGQFQREEVLFREAERLDLGLWLKRLLREKETLPSAAEALFCLAVILGLRWLSFGVGQHFSLLARTGVGQLAFVATPPLFMAILLTTRPARGLGLRLPPWWAWPAAALLAALVVPPLGELTLAILRQFPALRTLLELNHPLTRELHSLTESGGGASPGGYFFVLALLPALCEELAFRGFILQGLLRGFRPRSAILLSAFLFALYQMNVFQFVPHFVFGVILGLLVVRSGSVLPAMVFHLVYNVLLLAPAVLPGVRGVLERLLPSGQGMAEPTLPRLAVALACAALACLALVAIGRRGRSAGEQLAS